MFSRLSGAVYSLFYSSASVAQPVAATTAFEDEAYKIDAIETNPRSRMSEAAIAVYKALQDEGYQRYNPSAANTWANVVRNPRLLRHSKYPGHIMRDGKQLNFQDVDYFAEVDRNGEVSYQIKLKGSYYRIELHEIPDPAMKSIHARVMALLPKPVENENRVGNRK